MKESICRTHKKKIEASELKWKLNCEKQKIFQIASKKHL